jgi:hypothetical protein
MSIPVGGHACRCSDECHAGARGNDCDEGDSAADTCVQAGEERPTAALVNSNSKARQLT